MTCDNIHTTQSNKIYDSVIVRISPDENFGLQRQIKSPHPPSAGRKTSRRIDQWK